MRRDALTGRLVFWWRLLISHAGPSSSQIGSRIRRALSVHAVYENIWTAAAQDKGPFRTVEPPRAPNRSNSLQAPRYRSLGATSLRVVRTVGEPRATSVSDHRLHGRWRLGHVEVELHNRWKRDKAFHTLMLIVSSTSSRGSNKFLCGVAQMR